MKNTIRLLVIISLISHFSSLLSSCTTDAYDKGEGEYSLLRADFVEAHVGSDKRVDYVLTDDGDSLRTNPPFRANWITKPDTTCRALFYYKLQQGEAVSYNLSQVLMPSIKSVDQIKEGVIMDPVHLESIWRARSGRYLNLRLRVMTGEAEAGKTSHQVFGCASDTLVTYADGSRALYLRLYHNQNGQPEYYSHEVYLSIPLAGVQADTVIMRLQTYEGEYSKAFTI